MDLEKKLKQKLTIIKENNYEVQLKEEIQTLVPQMLENIGTTDSELRDKLIYSTFYFWIMNDEFSKDELKKLLNKSISETNLFFYVGETDSDSVFTRSFSVLIIPLVLNINQKHKFLKDSEILKVYTRLIEYFKLEKDYRGYVKGKGWAHSIAHTADALDEISRYEVIDEEKLMKILECIKEKITIDNYVYIDEEDERLVLAVYTILKRNEIDIYKIEKWIDSIIESYKKRRIYPEDNILLMNIKGFLRSLYFKTHGNEQLNHTSSYIKSSLDKIYNYNF